MTLDELLNTLKSKNAFIVHCGRSSRSGEINPKPYYPDDLKRTINDLETGGVRPVSCSVVWPTHQETYGEIGVIVRPREIEDVVRALPIDAGTLKDGQGFGESLSAAVVERTFTQSTNYNEWVLTGGEVVGIFLNLCMGLRVARYFDTEFLSNGHSLPPGVYQQEISVEQIACDFPGRRMYAFIGNTLVEIIPPCNSTSTSHPYKE